MFLHLAGITQDNLVNGVVENGTPEEPQENLTSPANREVHLVAKNDSRSPIPDLTNSSTNSDALQDPATEDSQKTPTAKSPTVQRILDLLNEMEATSQVEHCGLQKFHPCPQCLGKLITV